MAKKKLTSTTKITIQDILRGKFFVGEGAVQNWYFIFLVIFLLLIMISSAHWVDKKILKIKDLNEEVNEYKAKYAYINSKLMNLKLESELTKQVIKDSLKVLEEHPVKIIIPNK